MLLFAAISFLLYEAVSKYYSRTHGMSKAKYEFGICNEQRIWWMERAKQHAATIKDLQNQLNQQQRK